MILNWFKRKKPAKLKASAYLWPDRIMINTVSTTVPGFGVESEPYILLPMTASPGELGRAVLEALSHSKSGVPVPDDFKLLRKARFKAAKVSSERQFMQHSVHVAVQKDEQTFSLLPSRNGATRGDTKGFHFLPEREVKLSLTVDAETLGKALFETWGQCE